MGLIKEPEGVDLIVQTVDKERAGSIEQIH